jgi:hypothetical protein
VELSIPSEAMREGSVRQETGNRVQVLPSRISRSRPFSDLHGVLRSMVLSGSGRYQHIVDTPDLDFSSAFLRLRQIVGNLHPQPCLGTTPKGFFQADRHFG